MKNQNEFQPIIHSKITLGDLQDEQIVRIRNRGKENSAIIWKEVN